LISDHDFLTLDESHQIEVWIEHLDQWLWLHQFELNNVGELIPEYLRVCREDDVVHLKVANNLESEEHAP